MSPGELFEAQAAVELAAELGFFLGGIFALSGFLIVRPAVYGIADLLDARRHRKASAVREAIQ